MSTHKPLEDESPSNFKSLPPYVINYCDYLHVKVRSVPSTGFLHFTVGSGFLTYPQDVEFVDPFFETRHLDSCPHVTCRRSPCRGATPFDVVRFPFHRCLRSRFGCSWDLDSFEPSLQGLFRSSDPETWECSWSVFDYTSSREVKSC